MEEGIFQFDISKEDISRWKNDEVTQVFFGHIRALMEDNDRRVHSCLFQGDSEEAMRYNAAREEDDVILEIPDIMIDNLEKEGEDKNETTS